MVERVRREYTVKYGAGGTIASIKAPGGLFFQQKHWQQMGGDRFLDGYDEAIGPPAALHLRALLRGEREGGYHLLDDEAIDRKASESEEGFSRWESPRMCQSLDQCPFRRLGQCGGNLSTCQGRNG